MLEGGYQSQPEEWVSTFDPDLVPALELEKAIEFEMVIETAKELKKESKLETEMVLVSFLRNRPGLMPYLL